MASGPDAVLRQVRRLFGAGTLAGLAEGPLLERFLDRRDEAAFEALMARLGPMVLGVCRRTLRDEGDVEDAFQATFLILIRRAGTLRDRELLAPWLHRVALRVAIRAGVEAARRRMPALDAESLAAVPAPSPAPELRPTLDEELARLPEKYRAPVVLCYLEGRTHEEAARQLSWPVGTVKGRLSRARDLLRGRLARRGLAPSVGLLIGARATVPEALSATTIRAATAVAAGGGLVAGSVPASVAVLVRGVIKTMVGNTLKGIAAGLLAVGVLATGAGVLARQAPSPHATPPKTVARIEVPEAPTGTRPERIDPGDDPKGEEESEQIAEQLDEARIRLELLQEEVQSLKDAMLTQAKNNNQLAQILEFPAAAVAGNLRQETFDEAASRLAASRAVLEKIQAKYLEKSRQLRRETSKIASLEGRLKPAPSEAANPREPRGLVIRRVQPGDTLRVEVLQGSPGRPLQGRRVVRPDGTISLDFYGDLAVAGLTRREIKRKLVEHLQKFLTPESLALIDLDENTGTPKRDKDGKPIRIAPEDSEAVVVDDTQFDDRSKDQRIEELQRQVDRLREEMKVLLAKPSIVPNPRRR